MVDPHTTSTYKSDTASGNAQGQRHKRRETNNKYYCFSSHLPHLECHKPSTFQKYSHANKANSNSNQGASHPLDTLPQYYLQKIHTLRQEEQCFRDYLGLRQILYRETRPPQGPAQIGWHGGSLRKSLLASNPWGAASLRVHGRTKRILPDPPKTLSARPWLRHPDRQFFRYPAEYEHLPAGVRRPLYLAAESSAQCWPSWRCLIFSSISEEESVGNITFMARAKPFTNNKPMMRARNIKKRKENDDQMEQMPFTLATATWSSVTFGRWGEPTSAKFQDWASFSTKSDLDGGKPP
ncbi:hypothetical protein Cgig2_031349 [Carnegiea gigantea]|uniref:Uncharacterized protein n=1 Tax=Carnegiea gigantea TaxID=171969 RepID=A0A9Q1GMX4_9CARY|nr:hypothetical protein Cgig2_031349 [Carnegiea gigantea]